MKRNRDDRLHLHAVHIDPATATIQQKSEIARYPDGVSHEASPWLIGSPGNVIAYASGDGFAGYDLVAQKQVWNRHEGRGSVGVSTIEHAVYNAGAAVIHTEPHMPGEPNCNHDAIVDTSTGQDILTAKSCDGLATEGFPTVGILALFSDFDKRPAGAYNAVTKQKLIIDSATKWADERSTLVGVQQEGNANSIDIRDAVSGKSLFSINQDKGAAVSLTVMQLFNKQLYVTTTDEKLVLDATTGQTVTRGWTAYPDQVIDDWVLYSDGTLKKE